MAAGRATYSVRITRSQGKVLIENAIDGRATGSKTLDEISGNALRSAVQSVTRDSKEYAATNTVMVDVSITNTISSQVVSFTASPSGELTEKRTTKLTAPQAAPAQQPAARRPVAPTATQPGQHRAGRFAPASALPHRPAHAERSAPPPPPAYEPEPEPEPAQQLAWAQGDVVSDEVAEDEQSSPPPELIPVTDRKLRIKKTADTEEKGSVLSELSGRFKALSRVKQVLVVFAVVIVAFLGVRIVGGGGGDYTAICADQRTGMRNLDPAPCQQGTVRFFLWYFVESGETLPEPGSDYTSTPGTFDKPTSGKITYP